MPNIAIRIAVLTSVCVLMIGAGGCSKRPIKAEELQSNVISGISLAQETEMFIDYVREGRSTSAFAKGHIKYLEDTAEDESKELRDKAAETKDQAKLQSCRASFDSLTRELESLGKQRGGDAELVAAKGRIAEIRKELQEAEKTK